MQVLIYAVDYNIKSLVSSSGCGDHSGLNGGGGGGGGGSSGDGGGFATISLGKFSQAVIEFDSFGTRRGADGGDSWRSIGGVFAVVDPRYRLNKETILNTSSLSVEIFERRNGSHGCQLCYHVS
jgi:hypothetical protein